MIHIESIKLLSNNEVRRYIENPLALIYARPFYRKTLSGFVIRIFRIEVLNNGIYSD